MTGRSVIVRCVSWNGRHSWAETSTGKRCSKCGVGWYGATRHIYQKRVKS